MLKSIIFSSLLAVVCWAANDRSWTTEEGIKIEIIKKIGDSKCKIKSESGDQLEQFYKLSDKEGKVIGSNFGQKPYTFTLGKAEVIHGMDIGMEGMCVGEQRKVIIPPEQGFDEDGEEVEGKGDTLYYFVELKSIFRPKPGDKWITEDGVHIHVTHEVEDCTEKATAGDTLHQQYTLYLEDGTFVDSSWSRNRPFIFKMGTGQVIKGMDIAMEGMCEGERRKVVIPPELAYGEKGRPPAIPGNSFLHFDLQLQKLVRPGKEEL
ncbi:hypothetical protein L5515_008523 [Caenorhabditis briggsae]|uniref:peptidylprolyl isomerase n=1 Tax=Caenorhabditis briggsae TaxID=6238 RepID=A0AAE9JL10_CAEBR|nr:hypothetical protein L5515_008523 [Caenorhabditis briggsae]